MCVMVTYKKTIKKLVIRALYIAQKDPNFKLNSDLQILNAKTILVNIIYLLMNHYLIIKSYLKFQKILLRKLNRN